MKDIAFVANFDLCVTIISNNYRVGILVMPRGGVRLGAGP